MQTCTMYNRRVISCDNCHKIITDSVVRNIPADLDPRRAFRYDAYASLPTGESFAMHLGDLCLDCKRRITKKLAAELEILGFEEEV